MQLIFKTSEISSTGLRGLRFERILSVIIKGKKKEEGINNFVANINQDIEMTNIFFPFNLQIANSRGSFL